MKKMNVLLTIILLVLLPVVTIGSCQQQPESSSPTPPFPEKGNPKLDSQLNQLVRAERLGEADSFAEQSNIELIDGSVRVIIECVSGQIDDATLAATNAGAKLETSYDNLLQVVVPISSLTTLADAVSIHFIRLPQYPLPAATNGSKGLINGTEWQI